MQKNCVAIAEEINQKFYCILEQADACSTEISKVSQLQQL